MKRKWVLGVIFLLLAAFSGYAVFVTSNIKSAKIDRIFTGYLVCQACAGASQSIAMDGVNLLKNPEKHSVSCLRMPTCIRSGFGIFIKKPAGNYTYYKFDKTGGDLAYQQIVSTTKKADQLLVEVTGKFQNGIILINAITEKP